MKKIFQKIIIYISAAVLFTAAPALSVYAAETPLPTETPDTSPVETAPIPEIPALPETAPIPEIPVSPETPNTDTVTVTPLPDPSTADQDVNEVTPMQSTMYAASQKGLNVRSGPSTNHSKLGMLQYGTQITVTGKTADNWYQIQYSGGVGYVFADYVSSTPPSTPQNPATQNPAVQDPALENSDINAEVPPAETPNNTADNETPSEDSTIEEGNADITTPLIGTPVVVALAAAIVGVIALIGYSVYGLFKKDYNTIDEYYEDESYEQDEYYEDEQYSDDEYYENDEQYSDDEYYEDDEQYSDDEYYEDEESYSDDGDYDDQRHK